MTQLEQRAREVGLSIADAGRLLKEFNADGRVKELGGYRHPAANDYFEGCWFEYRGKLVSAHQFGIVTAAFDVLFDREIRTDVRGMGSVVMKIDGERIQNGERGDCVWCYVRKHRKAVYRVWSRAWTTFMDVCREHAIAITKENHQ